MTDKQKRVLGLAITAGLDLNKPAHMRALELAARAPEIGQGARRAIEKALLPLGKPGRVLLNPQAECGFAPNWGVPNLKELLWEVTRRESAAADGPDYAGDAVSQYWDGSEVE